ncbi:MAG: hypothetical protein ACAH21_13420 [Ramlibacter sp.]|nr:hypothetical protein [Ramlibacter sp.]
MSEAEASPMGAAQPKKEPPAPAPNGGVPRNGSGADTAFMAMVKKRKGQDGDESPPQPKPQDGNKTRKK